MCESREAATLKCVAAQAETTEVLPEHTLVGLGFDALDIVELLFALEREFHVHLPDEVVDGWISVEDVIRTITTLP